MTMLWKFQLSLYMWEGKKLNAQASEASVQKYNHESHHVAYIWG